MVSCTYTSTNINFANIENVEHEIGEIYISESGADMMRRTVSNLINNNIKLRGYTTNAICDLGDAGCFLDENGECNWIRSINYNIASYATGRENFTTFFNTLYKLKNSSITNLSFSYCPMSSLDFLSGFENLNNLSVTNSKIVNINSLKPNYDEDGNLVGGCPNLVTLSLTYNNIANISVLGDLSNLESIDLSGNIINSGIEELEKLQNLKTLNLTKNDLSKVDKYVNVGTGEGKDYFVNIFKNLHESGNLRELYLTETGVKNIRSRLEASGSWGLNSSQNSALQCDS